ncbi:MAG: DNA glycosylase AlkZ-like family protein, partial [Candidatus Bipolaricaulia bacterium]
MTISPERANRFTWRRQHLLERAAVGEALGVAKDICGLHAQISTVPALTLWARVAELEREQIDQMLYGNRSLIKVRSMRGTLHLLPTEDLSIYWRVVMGYQLEEWRRWLKRTGRLRPRQERERLYRLLLEALAEGPLTRSELSARFPQFVPESGASWGVDLKELCYLGKLCHARPQGAEARFARLDRWLPGVNLEAIGLATAQRRLVLSYLRGFGPATVQDFSHWAGFRVGDARPIFEAAAEELAELKIEGLKGP